MSACNLAKGYNDMNDWITGKHKRQRVAFRKRFIKSWEVFAVKTVVSKNNTIL